MTITKDDIARHAASGPWRSLVSIAEKLVADAEGIAGSAMRPLLGGGTRLMLSLHHRMSDDIDLFIRDPQWIGYLTPRVNAKTAAQVEGYEETAVALKLKLAEGELDFFVAMSLLGQPPQTIAGVAFALEPVAEVLAKKLFYRGATLTPRDLFDWWTIKTQSPQDLPKQKFAALLKDRLHGIEVALAAIRQSAAAREIWESLRAVTKPTLEEAVEFGLESVQEYRRIR